MEISNTLAEPVELRAIQTGYVQREIQQAAFEYQKAIESGEQVVETFAIERKGVEGVGPRQLVAA